MLKVFAALALLAALAGGCRYAGNTQIHLERSREIAIVIYGGEVRQDAPKSLQASDNTVKPGGL